MRLLRKFEQFADWLIPEEMKVNPFEVRKAKVLVYIHIFVLFISGLLSIIGFFLFPENQPLLFLGVALLGLSLMSVKKFGNLITSGNILALIFAVILVPSVSNTGGITSDNLLWLIMSPLLAFLFANRLSGLLWTLFLVGFTTYIFVLDMNDFEFYRSQSAQYNSAYYFTSYSMLFIFILFIIMIFKTGQEKIIFLLNENKKELEQQKQAILSQAKQLEEAKEKLKATNQELEHFAYAASHDLKEPLRMINNYTRLIGNRIQQHLDEESIEYMAFVTDGVTRMQRLLDDLLEYSRLGRNQNKKKTDLNNILMIVISNLMMAMKETNAAIYANQLPVVYSSSSEMMQLFQNIISNGLKFRQDGVVPEIRIRAVEQEEHYLISISDNGIGIAEEDQSRVFAIFERLHSSSEFEGTGIGLSTCKKIVNNMGGKIWLKSARGQGTTFFFTLPKIDSPVMEPSREPVPA